MKQCFLYSVLCFLFMFVAVEAQIIEANKYGLKVVSKYNDYKALVEKDSLQALIDLKKFIPGIKLDIRYATKNNFMKEPVYKLKKAFARRPAAEALKSVQCELKSQGLGLKIFDGYRPYSVTVKFYEKMRDTVFFAVPWRGSRHNRGCAIDLTLIVLKTGKELPMPTPYDDFTEKAHVNYKNLPEQVIKNRELLISIMTKHGFKVLADEWWHFDYVDWKRFDLTDIPFEML